MDWTPKTTLQWDWEQLALFSRKEAEIKPAQQSDWKFDGVHGDNFGNSNGSSYSSGGGACSGSELGNGSVRSSISVSIGSPSRAGTKTPELNFDSVERYPEILKNKDIAGVETGILHRVVASDGPKESLIGLKLGKRTYFEDVSEGNNVTNSSLASVNPSTGLVKKLKVSQQNMQSSYCQVEGCNVDLITAKDYHRKHRVCESHSKSPKVTVAGQERRFCQQCSRFHDLSEFDQKKRSCRRRLSDHNARRRKPQPDTISFSSSVLSASYYDDRQRMSLIFGRASFAQVTNMASSTWDDPGGFKLIPTKGSWVNYDKSVGTNGNLHLQCTGISKKISMGRHDLDRFLSFKGTTAKILDKGLGAPVASYLDGASDLRHARSLLSTESWVPSNEEPISDFEFVNTSTTPAHSAIHPIHAATGIWQQDELPLTTALPFHLQSNSSQFQEFLLHKTPDETHFFDSTLMH